MNTRRLVLHVIFPAFIVAVLTYYRTRSVRDAVATMLACVLGFTAFAIVWGRFFDPPAVKPPPKEKQPPTTDKP